MGISNPIRPEREKVGKLVPYNRKLVSHTGASAIRRSCGEDTGPGVENLSRQELKQLTICLRVHYETLPCSHRSGRRRCRFSRSQKLPISSWPSSDPPLGQLSVTTGGVL